MEATPQNVEKFLVARVRVRRAKEKLRQHEGESVQTSSEWIAWHHELLHQLAMAEEVLKPFPKEWETMYTEYDGTRRVA